MPVGVKGSMERLQASHETMDKLKNSPVVIVQNMFESIVGRRLPWNVRIYNMIDLIVFYFVLFEERGWMHERLKAEYHDLL